MTKETIETVFDWVCQATEEPEAKMILAGYFVRIKPSPRHKPLMLYITEVIPGSGSYAYRYGRIAGNNFKSIGYVASYSDKLLLAARFAECARTAAESVKLKA